MASEDEMEFIDFKSNQSNSILATIYILELLCF